MSTFCEYSLLFFSSVEISRRVSRTDSHDGIFFYFWLETSLLFSLTQFGIHLFTAFVVLVNVIVHRHGDVFFWGDDEVEGVNRSGL